jgi:sulfur carrier protein ThiS
MLIGGVRYPVKIVLRPKGVIRRYVDETDINVPSGITPRRLIGDLNIPDKLKMAAFVNGKKRSLDDELKDGDEVNLITLLGGG